MNWNDILKFFQSEPGLLEVCLRLGCAMLVGMIIGTEREYTNRPAGMRTHILVALGASVVAVTGQIIFHDYQALGASPDPARLSAQVIAGVGFLGAGTIIRDGYHVKGLTTAASLWATACLGLAAGHGYYLVSLVGMVLIFITLTLFEWLQGKLIHPHAAPKSYILETTDISATLQRINSQAQFEQLSVENLQAAQLENNCYRITFMVKYQGSRGKQRQESLFQNLATAPEIRSVRQDIEPAATQP